MTGRVIVITSGKGGVGKTTTNANIGTALARAGKKVVMVDTDLGLRNLDLLLGLENRIVDRLNNSIVDEPCENDIDWNEVNEKLREMRDIGSSFLLNNI